MAGKFELWTDKGGDWRFNLKASNGQVIATSQGYASKASAMNGIDSVKSNAPGAEVVETRQVVSRPPRAGRRAAAPARRASARAGVRR